MKANFCKFTAVLLVLFALLPLSAKVVFFVAADKPDAVYQAGETAAFTISVKDNGKAAAGMDIVCAFRGEKDLPAPQKLTLDAKGQAQVKVSLTHPGEVQIALSLPEDKATSGKAVRKYYGAVFSPEKIRPVLPPPADFNEFWDKEKAAMQKLPLNAVMEEVETKPGFKAWAVRLDAPEGRFAYGYLTMPENAKPHSLPIWLKVHGAGTYLVSPLFNKNAVIFSVHPHELPGGKPQKFYDDAKRKLSKLANGRYYMYFNEYDRTKSYFLGMYRRDYRAMQFLTGRPEWNGKDFVVNGRSQGGGQALVCGGLEPRITVVLAQEPGMCDWGAFQAGRISGWPYGNPNTRKFGDVNKLLIETAYFDAANFARNIKNARCVVTTGFSDVTCVSTGVYAAFNVIPSPDKKMLTNPRLGHGSKWPDEAYSGNVVRLRYGKTNVMPF